MATDASMDRPIATPFSDAMDTISAKLREVEAALVARAREHNVTFRYETVIDDDNVTRFVAEVRPAGLFVAHGCLSDLAPLGGASVQLRLLLADVIRLLCEDAVSFYDGINELSADCYTTLFDDALSALARGARLDMRGASMPRN